MPAFGKVWVQEPRSKQRIADAWAIDAATTVELDIREPPLRATSFRCNFDSEFDVWVSPFSNYCVAAYSFLHSDS